jgi:glycosyltransferase involved in cell wall biosynthesis
VQDIRVSAYVHLHRTRTPTGVGQHIIQMVRGLGSTPGISVEVAAPRGQLDSSGQIPAGSPLAGLPAAPLPLASRWLEASWRFFNWPAIERWCPEADWIYCPAETFVATRKAALAVTVHDLYALEPDLPWSGTPEHQAERRRWSKLFAQIRRHAKLILAVSEFTKQRLVSLLDFDPRMIAVVGNGIEKSYFTAGIKTPPGADVPSYPYVLTASGLLRKKGAEYLVELARRLATLQPDMRILVTGSMEKHFEEVTAPMNNVVRLGYVPIARQVNLMRFATAVLMLSRYEGSGIPALEAMAAGTPVVVSRFASLPEVVGDAGLIVDAPNTDSVADAIARLRNDSALREGLIERGKKRAEQFHWSAAIEKLVAALRAAS